MTARWKIEVLRRGAAFAVAAAVMVIAGSAAHSYFVQHAWSIAAGNADGTGSAAIPFADRIAWAAHDLGGMILPYAGVTSMSLLIAFFAAGIVVRFTRHRVTLFGIAGALALFALFTVMRKALGTVGVFGARGVMGLTAQMAVGFFAGVLFAKLTTSRQ